MGRILRERVVGELARRYQDTRDCVFVDFSGLDVEAIAQLRERMRKRNIEFFVVKNSLLKLAMEKVGLPTSDELFIRPTAIVTGGDDPIAVCRIVVDWQKRTKTTEIKGGLLDRKLVTGRQVVELSALPSRQVMLSQVLGLFLAPLTGIAGLLNNTVVQVANLLHNHIEKLEEEG
jgi:large subunit ribosomal protein L10